jgi:hypothetical protein
MQPFLFPIDNGILVAHQVSLESHVSSGARTICSFQAESRSGLAIDEENAYGGIKDGTGDDVIGVA